MGLELFMLGLIVEDMGKSLAFYQKLGVAIPDDSDDKSHVEVKMGSGLTFFLDSRPNRWDAKFARSRQPETPTSPDSYPSVLEFYLKTQAVVIAKYDELTAAGYEGYRAPYETVFNMCFAMVKDPDGNTILLSGDVEKKG